MRSRAFRRGNSMMSSTAPRAEGLSALTGEFVPSARGAVQYCASDLEIERRIDLKTALAVC
jgi:hypothetical protein